MSTRPAAGPNPSSESSPPSHSMSVSVNSSAIHQHAPLTPSGLHETQTLPVSPEDTGEDKAETSGFECSPRHSPALVGRDGAESIPNVPAIVAKGQETEAGLHREHNEEDEETSGAQTSLWRQFGISAGERARETTSLLRRPIEFVTGHAHPGPCNHGTFSPQPNSRAASIRSSDSNKNDTIGSNSRGIFGNIADGLVGGGPIAKKMSTTARLVEEHGIKNSSVMYVHTCPQMSWLYI